MGLLDRFLNRGYSKGVPQSTQFHESDTTVEPEGSRNAPRRELVHVVLRDTMRKHGIPSDWIDCRILTVVTRQGTPGLHVQFIVLQGEDRLLDYVHAFQNSFWIEIERYEAKVREWLLSVSWQFEGEPAHDLESLPGPGTWIGDVDTQPSEIDHAALAEDEHAADLASDLKALYAIRDAAIAPAAEPAAEPPVAGGGHPP
jgi:hypothetical protein